MLRLLGRANSSNVMKVIWLLEELGVPYEREDYGGGFGKTQTADYLAMNPNAVVPTLVDGGFALWESNAILRYLAAKHAAGTAMWPADLQARANIDRWMDWQQTTLGPPMTPVFWGIVRTAPEKRDWPAIHAAAEKCAKAYDLLDHVLSSQDYVAGPSFTPADIAIGVHAHRWVSFEGITRPAQPAVHAWYARLMERPAFKAHIALPMT